MSPIKFESETRKNFTGMQPMAFDKVYILLHVALATNN